MRSWPGGTKQGHVWVVTVTALRGRKHYIRPDLNSRITESNDVSRSYSQDSRRKATRATKLGYREHRHREPALKLSRKKTRAGP
jgi:hypothetical protein